MARRTDGRSSSENRSHAAPAYDAPVPQLAPGPQAPRVPAGLTQIAGDGFEDGTQWSAVEFRGALDPGQVADVEIAQSRLVGAAFTGVELERLRLVDTVAEGCDFSGTSVVQATFVRVTFLGCRMLAFDAAQADLRHVDFRECRLDEANFRMATGERVQFDRSALRGADFYGARMEALRLFDCDLSGVEFSQAVVRGARLHGSKLEGLRGAGSLRDVTIESAQVLPMALQILGALGVTVDDDRETTVADGDAPRLQGARRRARS